MKKLLFIVLTIALLLPFNIVQSQELEGPYSVKHVFSGCRNNLNQKVNLPAERVEMFVKYSRTDKNGTDIYHLCAGTVCNTLTAVGRLWHHDGDVNGQFHVYDPTYLASVNTPGEAWGRYNINNNFDLKGGFGFALVYQQNYSGPFTSCKLLLKP